VTGPEPPVPPPAERMAAVLSTIAAQARRTNLVRAAEIRTALDRAEVDDLDRAGWAAAERTAHQLAGSAGTFGFAGVSEWARYLERFCAEAAAQPPDSARLGDARTVLERATQQLSGEPELD
jgi:HPt (histidine-containing phosphotransfer) domain-containing protein